MRPSTVASLQRVLELAGVVVSVAVVVVGGGGVGVIVTATEYLTIFLGRKVTHEEGVTDDTTILLPAGQ